MAELLSVGLDVGTTTTQLILSRLQVENQASGFAVPQMEITKREVIYSSPVHFTPLLGQDLVDADKLRTFVEAEYAAAGILREQVDTGAIIITGETSRKENARAVLEALSSFAGDFVVATAGPDLESILAANGAGAVAYSADTGKTVLHMDIGGGTSNLALIENGRIIRTGCLNVGGRLLKTDTAGKLTYVSPVLRELTNLRPGDYPDSAQIAAIVQTLTQGLEMAAGLRPATALLDALLTREAETLWRPPDDAPVLSFSGGVADCIKADLTPGLFGDIGVELGRAIGSSALCRGAYILGQHTIRATVIGAGCHSAQLSGSTVFYRGVALPLQNLPVAAVTEQEQLNAQIIARRLAATDSEKAVLALPGYVGATYEQVEQLADAILQGFGDRQILVCLEQDMAKALGQRLFLQSSKPCLCIDRVRLTTGSYLDVGQSVGPCLPVVVKTLIFNG